MSGWTVGYPVDFSSGGDETHVAIGKHIAEINKIYGHLNELKEEIGSIAPGGDVPVMGISVSPSNMFLTLN